MSLYGANESNSPLKKPLPPKKEFPVDIQGWIIIKVSSLERFDGKARGY